MGSKNNPTTVAGEAIRDLRTDDSRGTEAATAASARAVQLRELWPPKVFSCSWILDWCEPGIQTRNSMNVFTIHLGRVYRACLMKERIDFAVGLAAGNSLQNR
jgi:hypothetical protein